MPGRCWGLVQHHNQPRPTAAEAIDEDDEEEYAFYHHTHPPGYGGGPLEGASCLGFSSSCQYHSPPTGWGGGAKNKA